MDFLIQGSVINEIFQENFDLLLSQPWHVLGMEEDEVKVAMKK